MLVFFFKKNTLNYRLKSVIQAQISIISWRKFEFLGRKFEFLGQKLHEKTEILSKNERCVEKHLNFFSNVLFSIKTNIFWIKTFKFSSFFQKFLFFYQKPFNIKINSLKKTKIKLQLNGINKNYIIIFSIQ